MSHRQKPFSLSIQIATMISILANSACLPIFGRGRDDKKTPDKVILPTETSPSSDLRWLVKEDPECVNSVQVSEITIYEWDGRQTAAKKVPFIGSAGPDKEFVSTKVIGSLVGYQSHYNCKLSAAGAEDCAVDKSKSSTVGKGFSMCRANGTYGRDSLESLVLTTQYYTESAYRFYESIEGSRLPGIKKAILVPQPLFKRHYTRADGTTYDKIDVNNASFVSVPATETQAELPVFFIYPTSLKSFAQSPVNLWEVPFVMSHEFGHHVLNHYIKKTLSLSSLSLAKDGSFESIMPMPSRKHPDQYALGLTADTSAPQFALDGINETFADLFGYFAGGGAKNQLAGVRCLDVSRDPSSAVTAKGSPKGLDKARVDIYEGRASALETTECTEPQYDDEHDIATALGQPIASFIEDVTPSMSAMGRAEILLTWATKINTLVATPSNVSLDTLVVELVKAVKLKNPLVAAACVNFKAAITGLPKASAACVD
jgi:hypothetical protein